MGEVKNVMPKAMAVQAQAAKKAKPAQKTVKAAAKPKAHNIKTKKK